MDYRDLLSVNFIFSFFSVIFISLKNKLVNMKKSFNKGLAWWLAPVFGIPFIILFILILLFLVFFFGIVFLFKNIIWIAIVIGGIFIAYQMAKGKMLKANQFMAFILIVLTIWLIGSFFHLFALGITQPKSQIIVNVGQPMNLLAYGYEEEGYLNEEKFSFTCMSPLAETVGCRLAPSTYRPIEIDECNKDPELPLPPHLVILAVDIEHDFRTNEEITLSEMRDWGKVEHGDVFIVDTRDRTFWDNLVDWIKGRGQLDQAHGKKLAILTVEETIPKGKCLSQVLGKKLGVDSDGKPYLFLVADRGAKINSNHILQVALVESLGRDNYRFDRCEWYRLDCYVMKILVWTWDRITGAFKIEEPRTVFAVGMYKFLVAYPYVEILIILGVIGVVFAIVSKLMGWW
jgi:hypothetical protein